MKEFAISLLIQLKHFFNPQTSQKKELKQDWSETIEKAISQGTAIHLIWRQGSFTGNIVKHDREKDQLIVKNFQKNVSRIIRISDIQRIRFVPSTIQTAQKRHFSKKASE